MSEEPVVPLADERNGAHLTRRRHIDLARVHTASCPGPRPQPATCVVAAAAPFPARPPGMSVT